MSISARKVDTLKPVLCGDQSVSETAMKSGYAEAIVRAWLKEILATKSLKEVRANYIFRKDKNGVYLWHNKRAFDLQSPGQPSAVGLTDDDLNPEKAEYYQGFDREAQKTGKRITAKEQVYFLGDNYFTAVAEIIPLTDDNGDSAGVLLFSRIDYRLAEQPFPAVLSIIRKSGAYSLVRFDRYRLKIDDTYSINLSRKECEIALYLLTGSNAAEIGQKTGFKTRTVEGYLAKMRDKFGVDTKSQLVDAIIKSELLSKL